MYVGRQILVIISRYKEPEQLSGMALGYGLYDQGFEYRQELGIFSSPPSPGRFWGPHSLLSNGYQGFFPWGKAAEA
jgi:hypothetical protein